MKVRHQQINEKIRKVSFAARAARLSKGILSERLRTKSLRNDALYADGWGSDYTEGHVH